DRNHDDVRAFLRFANEPEMSVVQCTHRRNEPDAFAAAADFFDRTARIFRAGNELRHAGSNASLRSPCAVFFLCLSWARSSSLAEVADLSTSPADLTVQSMREKM